METVQQKAERLKRWLSLNESKRPRDKLYEVTAREWLRAHGFETDKRQPIRQPILNDEIAIQNFVEEDCGADGWALKGGKLVALRDNGDGTHTAIKTYEVDSFGRG